MSRASLDQVGLVVAQAWAMRATCARKSVGCALFDAGGFLLSTGYNGPASGQAHCTDRPCPGAGLPSGSGLHLCEAVHAEANALLRCRDVSRVHACYVTHSPCLDCVKLLLNTGCRRIVFGERYAHDGPARERWTRDAPAIPCPGCEMPGTCRAAEHCYILPTREWLHEELPEYVVATLRRFL